MHQPMTPTLLYAIQSLGWIYVYRRTQQQRGYALVVVLSIAAVALSLAAMGDVAYNVASLCFAIAAVLQLARVHRQIRREEGAPKKLAPQPDLARAHRGPAKSRCHFCRHDRDTRQTLSFTAGKDSADAAGVLP